MKKRRSLWRSPHRQFICLAAAVVMISGCSFWPSESKQKPLTEDLATYQMLSVNGSGSEDYPPGLWVLNKKTGGVEFCEQPARGNNVTSCYTERADNFR